MSLLTLPPEIMAIIFEDLDIYTLLNLYNTCKQLRYIVSQGLVKECDFSGNEASILRTSFFKDISRYLRVLNLSDVEELNFTFLIEALSDMKNLIDLDLRETDITIPNLLELVKVIPLQNIAINFCFGKEDDEWKLTEDELLEYQEAFQGLKNVHFLGETSTMYRKMAMGMLEKADLCDLTLTCTGTIDIDDDWDKMDFEREAKMLKFLKFQALFEDDYCYTGIELPIFKIDINKFEIFIFGYDYESGKQMIKATPLVKKIMDEILNKKGINSSEVLVGSLTELPTPMHHSASQSVLQMKLKRWLFERESMQEVFVIIWDKERTKFGSEFNAKLLSIYLERAENFKFLNDSDSDYGLYYHHNFDCDSDYDEFDYFDRY